MQASKIKIGGLYAIRLEDELVRFEVSEVVTRRVSAHGNPHDFKSHVLGRVREGNNSVVNIGFGSGGKEITVGPDALLGFYDEHVELVARANVEKAAKEKAEQDQTAKLQELWRLLYAKTGMVMPNDDADYKQPFRQAYGRAVEIRDNGIEPLLDYLRNSERR